MDESNQNLEQIEFSYDGFQVVRREFFAHLREPGISIKSESITFNAACITKISDVQYIQLLINPEKKKLVVRPCDLDDKDSIRWCLIKEDKRKSRTINCKLFAAKLFDMLDWDFNCRYKLQGVLVEYEDEKLFSFDLMDTEIFTKKEPVDYGEPKPTNKTPYYPEAWRDSFGLSVVEHEKALNIDLLDGYVNFNISSNPNSPTLTKQEDKEGGGVSE